jgi:hypothetical protein
VNRLVLWVLRSPAHRLLSGALLDLRYTGSRSGRAYALPVQYAADGDRCVVYPGHAERKVWWRSLIAPAPITAVVRGATRTGTGRVLTPADLGCAEARAVYAARWPKAAVSAEAPLVVLDLAPGPSCQRSGGP